MRRAGSFTLFLLVFAAILALGVWVVSDALGLAFAVPGVAQWLLTAGMGALSASFIAATILGNYHYNWFTRLYYFVSAVWMGCFLYFFFASVIYGAVVAFLPTLTGTGPALFTIALCASVYGIVHARRIVVVSVPVSLPNLPSSWKGKKVVWISDLHLGQIHGPAFARRVVAQVEALAPDIVFVGGDLYDGTGAPDVIELTAPLRHLSAPLGAYFITGNHEEYGNQERFLLAVRAVGMRVLQDELVVIDGLQLVGVDYKNASDEERFRAILKKLAINPNVPSILLKHEPRHLDTAQAAGISLQISGHTHNAQQWPLTYIAQRTYKGFAYGLKKIKTMQVYTSSGVGTWGPPMRVGTQGEIVFFTFS